MTDNLIIYLDISQVCDKFCHGIFAAKLGKYSLDWWITQQMKNYVFSAQRVAAYSSTAYKWHCSEVDTIGSLEVLYNFNDFMILTLGNVTIQKSNPSSSYAH